MPISRRTTIRIKTHEITIIRFGANTCSASVEPSADVQAYAHALLIQADESAVETQADMSGDEVTQTAKRK